VGQDHVEYVDFIPHVKAQVSRPEILEIIMVPSRREILFRPKNAGESTVFVRNMVGEISARFMAKVGLHDKSKIVQDLRAHLGDIEGIEIGIRGDDVYVGGRIVVPNDIGRVAVILEKYHDVLCLVELSPQAQRTIARQMQTEIQRHGMRNVTVRVVNGSYWLEGIVDSKEKRERAQQLAVALLPASLLSLAERTHSTMKYNGPQVLQNYINSP